MTAWTTFSIILVLCLIPVYVFLGLKRDREEIERLRKENREAVLGRAEMLLFKLYPWLEKFALDNVNAILLRRAVVEYLAYTESLDGLGLRGEAYWEKLKELGNLMDEAGSLLGLGKVSGKVYSVYDDYVEAEHQERQNRQRQRNFDDAMSYFARLERKSRW